MANQRSIPSWLDEPPNPIEGQPPVQSRPQELPFSQLTWENFERLCLRLARYESTIKDHRIYGERGDNQEGIDLYASSNNSDKFIVYQCKREQNFGPQKIANAVQLFLNGAWKDKTDEFVLCTQEGLRSKQRADAREKAKKSLEACGISFSSWDSEELSIKGSEFIWRLERMRLDGPVSDATAHCSDGQNSRSQPHDSQASWKMKATYAPSAISDA